MATKAQLAALAKARAARKKKAAAKLPPAKKAAKRRATRRQKNTVPGYYPNPVSDQYVVTTIMAGETYYLETWRKDGALMDTNINSALRFTKKGADAMARALEDVHTGTKATVKKLNATPKKNPVPPSSVARQLKEAGNLFQEFTGHEADYYDTVPHDPVKVGLKVGTVDAILYTTVRDGITEHYKHDFRKSSRPTLVASHNGKALALVGGKYRFTDRGIVDI